MSVNFFFFNKFAKYIAKGVFPDPPLLIFPTQITGIPTLFIFFTFLSILEIKKYKKLNGNKIKIIIFSIRLLFLDQKLG